MHRLASRDPARTPWASNLVAEPGHVQRLVVGADGVEGLVPGRQELAGRGVEVAAAGLVPDRQAGVVVLDRVGGWPPDLVVGGGEDLAQLGAGQGAADGDVDVRGEPPLGFDGGEVLDVVAEEAAQVLDEPVEQRREVQRVPGRPLVVVGGRVGRGAVGADRAVAGAGEGEEHRRPERLAVRRGVGLADRPGVDLPPGQVRGVLAAPGGPVTRGPAWRAGTLPRIPERVICSSSSPISSSSSAVSCAGRRGPGRGRRWASARSSTHMRCSSSGSSAWTIGLVVEVPAFAALRGPQGLGPFGAGRADRGEGVPAGDEHWFGLAGVQVGAAELDRADAAAVLDGQVADDVAGQRHGQPLCSGRGLGHSASISSGSAVSGRGR